MTTYTTGVAGMNGWRLRPAFRDDDTGAVYPFIKRESMLRALVQIDMLGYNPYVPSLSGTTFTSDGDGTT